MLFIDFLLILLAIFGAVTGLAGVAQLTNGSASFTFGMTLMVVGFSVAILAYQYSKRRKERKEKAEKERTDDLIKSLTKKPWPKDKVWVAPCKVTWPITVIVCVLAPMSTSAAIAKLEPLIWLLSAVLCLGGLILMLKLLSEGPNPALIFAARDIAIPGWGRIPWLAIDGIEYREINVKSTTQRFFILFVPELHRYLDKASWITRLFFSIRFGKAKQRLQVLLPEGPIAPKAIEEVARFLWTQATGKVHRWSSSGSNEFNEALKQRDAVITELESPDKFAEEIRSVQNMTPEQQAEFLAKLDASTEELKARTEKFTAANNVINDELKRRSRWAIGLSVVAILLFVIAALGKLHVWG